MRGQLRLKRVYEQPPVEAARDRRTHVALLAWLTTGAAGGPLRITDISKRGFGGRSQVRVPIGSEVRLNIPGAGIVRAQIRWALGGVFGARFLGGLSGEQLTACLAKGALAEANSPPGTMIG